jgi:hypothetical protein
MPAWHSSRSGHHGTFQQPATPRHLVHALPVEVPGCGQHLSTTPGRLPFISAGGPPCPAAPHDLADYLALLCTEGRLVLVGLPPEALQLPAWSLTSRAC